MSSDVQTRNQLKVNIDLRKATSRENFFFSIFLSPRQYTEPRGHSTRRRRNQPPPNQDLAHRASWLESVKQCTVL